MLEKPDIILCAMPTIDLTEAAVLYGIKYNVPVVIDIRDLWPDIYLDYFPTILKPFISFVVKFSKVKLKAAFEKSSALFGLTSEYLNWGVQYAGREPSEHDRVFHMGYKSTIPDELEIENGIYFWREQGLRENDFLVCFFGQIGNAVDLHSVIDAAKITAKNSKIKYVICGTGEKLKNLKKAASRLENVLFPGWIDSNRIISLMRISSVGLMPYKHSKNYEMNMPNKFAEYLSGGLPVLISIEGIMKQVLEAEGCGYSYDNPKELAELITKMENHDFDIKDMSRRAYNLFERVFKAEKIYEEMILHLEQICKEYKKKHASHIS